MIFTQQINERDQTSAPDNAHEADRPLSNSGARASTETRENPLPIMDGDYHGTLFSETPQDPLPNAPSHAPSRISSEKHSPDLSRLCAKITNPSKTFSGGHSTDLQGPFENTQHSPDPHSQRPSESPQGRLHTVSGEHGAQLEKTFKNHADTGHPFQGEPDAPRPLMHHLHELRWRIACFLVAWVAASMIGYAYRSEVLAWLVAPFLAALQQHNTSTASFLFTHVAEGFLVSLKVSCWFGWIACLPYATWHIWRFVRPAITPAYRRFYAAFTALVPLLFYAGLVLVHQSVGPTSMAFFLDFQVDTPDLNLRLLPKLAEYVRFCTSMMTGFGLGFQIPVVLSMAVGLGWVRLETLRRMRKYAFVAIVIVAAIVTPPDIYSPLILAIPTYALYEITVWLLGRMHQKTA